MVGPVSGELTNKTGGIDVAQPKTTRKRTAQIDGCCAKVRAACPLWVKSRHVLRTSLYPLSANSGHSSYYSITSSARPISVLGMLRPSAFAVLRLMTSSTLVAC